MTTRVNIVTEIGCNHCGNFDIAAKMILEARNCGADYVKFQKRDIDSMPDEVRNSPYNNGNSFGATYGEHRAALEFKKEQWVALRDYAKSIDIGFFATPFDIPSLKFLVDDLKLDYVKLGSTQIHDNNMLDCIERNRSSMPDIILSTGMCNMSKVFDVVARVSPNVIMQTTSCYPCCEADVNLNVIREYKKLCGYEEVGLSGHYISGNGAIEAAAVALGATWIERHFTLDRTWKGTDQAASLEPKGLESVVKAVRTVERAMGNCCKHVCECELPTLRKIKNG